MPLQLHINSGGHWLIDTDLGCVQVGEAYQNEDGAWIVTFVDGNSVESRDLETALQLVANKYDASRVQIGPMADAGNWIEEGEEDDEDVQIIDLPVPNKSD